METHHPHMDVFIGIYMSDHWIHAPRYSRRNAKGCHENQDLPKCSRTRLFFMSVLGILSLFCAKDCAKHGYAVHIQFFLLFF
ncbi:hypothetical protein Tco_1280821 [Tanacetum coccineum]